ncbi:MAG: hypothetical protein AAFR54_06720 [Planctomycetota bacterium]
MLHRLLPLLACLSAASEPAVAAARSTQDALPAHGDESNLARPAAISLGDVVTDWLSDLDAGFANAALRHTRIGSGHFVDILKTDSYGFSHSALVRLRYSDDWQTALDRFQAELDATPLLVSEGWERQDSRSGFGRTYLRKWPEEHREIGVQLFYGSPDDDSEEFVGLYFFGRPASYERDAIPLADIPPRPGETVSLMWALDTDEARSAFSALLDSAVNDFEGQTERGADGRLRMRRSALNPDSPLPFLTVEEYPERIDVWLDPAPEGGDTYDHVLRILSELGYSALLPDTEWEPLSDGTYRGRESRSHVVVEWHRDEESRHSTLLISAIRSEFKELHERGRLVPSDFDPRVAPRLGCISGDCENGFGELRFLDPTWQREILAYRGRFRDGRFHGAGQVHELIGVADFLEFDLVPEPTTGNLQFFGHFEHGVARTVNEPLPWATEMDLCMELNRPYDCDVWIWSLDQLTPQEDGFSVAVFRTRSGGGGGVVPSFIQHRTFEDGRTVVIDRPFTVDFGEPLDGTCRAGPGTLRLAGIGTLEADFDASGAALDRAFLTLLSGEVYEVRIQDGIPLSFERVAVPDGLSWAKAARSGAWIMLRENTCLAGDVRTDSFVRSLVRDADGAPRKSPGYHSRTPSVTPGEVRESFTLYYHTGVVRLAEMRATDPLYRMSRADSGYFDVAWNARYVGRETILMGAPDARLMLDGTYPYELLGEARTAYFRDDARFKDPQCTTPFGSVDEERKAAERERYLEQERRAYAEIEAWVEAKRAAEEARAEQARAARRPQRSTPSFSAFGGADVAAMNSIFARPSAAGETSGSVAATCSHCLGLGHVFVEEWRRVRRVEESTHFFTSYYVNEKVDVCVSCPSCLGTGKARRR